MRYDYFLEYDMQTDKVLDFLEFETNVEIDYEWQGDTIVIYTDEDPKKIEDMVWEECRVSPVFFGEN